MNPNDVGRLIHVLTNGMYEAPHSVMKMTSFKSRTTVYTNRLEKKMPLNRVCFLSAADDFVVVRVSASV